MFKKLSTKWKNFKHDIRNNPYLRRMWFFSCNLFWFLSKSVLLTFGIYALLLAAVSFVFWTLAPALTVITFVRGIAVMCGLSHFAITMVDKFK